MADSYLELMKAIISELRGDSTLSVLVSNRVYTEIPQDETFPYCYVSVESNDFSTKTTTGMAHVIQVQGFSRDASPKEAADIRAAVYDALNRQEANITLDSLRLVDVNFITGDIFKEDDGITWQSVIQFRAVVT